MGAASLTPPRRMQPRLEFKAARQELGLCCCHTPGAKNQVLAAFWRPTSGAPHRAGSTTSPAGSVRLHHNPITVSPTAGRALTHGWHPDTGPRARRLAAAAAALAPAPPVGPGGPVRCAGLCALGWFLCVGLDGNTSLGILRLRTSQRTGRALLLVPPSPAEIPAEGELVSVWHGSTVVVASCGGKRDHQHEP
jgi:hypothetical protein